MYSAFIFSGVHHQTCFDVTDYISSIFIKSLAHGFLEPSHKLKLYFPHTFEAFDKVNNYSNYSNCISFNTLNPLLHFRCSK